MQTDRPARTADIEKTYRAEGERLFYALLAYSGDPEIARESVAEAFARAIASAAAMLPTKSLRRRVGAAI
jgi:predicted RNA polymerase sigma factor